MYFVTNDIGGYHPCETLEEALQKFVDYECVAIYSARKVNADSYYN